MMTTCQGKFWAVSFNSEIPWNPPLAATLGGIIEQYFGGSGNEVGTRSGCCQDGRAPPHLLLLLLLLLLQLLPRLIHQQHLQLEPHSYHFTPRISASKDVTNVNRYFPLLSFFPSPLYFFSVDQSFACTKKICSFSVIFFSFPYLFLFTSRITKKICKSFL